MCSARGLVVLEGQSLTSLKRNASRQRHRKTEVRKGYLILVYKTDNVGGCHNVTSAPPLPYFFLKKKTPIGARVGGAVSEWDTPLSPLTSFTFSYSQTVK